MATDGFRHLWKFITKMPLSIFFKNTRNVFRKDELGLEIFHIALPAALALAADPVASLIDTAFIGHIGPVELAAVGVAIAIFNQASKIAIFPLVNVTTSFVAEEDAIGLLSPESQDVELEGGSVVNEEMEELFPNAESAPPLSSFINSATKAGYERKHIPSASSALVCTYSSRPYSLFLLQNHS